MNYATWGQYGEPQWMKMVLPQNTSGRKENHKKSETE
jgi:hypothetical protein